MSLIISCETKSNAREGMSLASLSDWFQGFCVFLLRYSLKTQQPACLPCEGGLAGRRRLGPHLAWSCKHRASTPVTATRRSHGAGEADAASSCKKTKIFSLILDPWEKRLNTELQIPACLSSEFPCRGVSLEMKTGRERGNRLECHLCSSSCWEALTIRIALMLLWTVSSKGKPYWVLFEIIF